ncbi:hypothetical protein PGQ11_011018 [Apiospora arundinis]|uniref:Uncharacterized protein n=1 Tax=Apiospora arundinis TaxID=335852 RepID=A0ABR2HYZ7_9PEZI
MRRTLFLVLNAGFAMSIAVPHDNPGAGANVLRRDGETEFDPDFFFKAKRDGDTEFDPDYFFKN